MIQILKRFGWFFAINILIVATLGVVSSLLGIDRWAYQSGIDYQNLLLFCLFYGFSGAFISLALSRMLAKWMMRIQLVGPNTPGSAGFVARKVQELSRAAQLPSLPEVGVYESPDVNAFATGPTQSRSLVAVSTGLLHTMSEDEIEGVLAHEISHIKNGDMVTMTLLQGLINAFVMFLSRIIAFAVSQAMRGEGGRNSSLALPVRMFVTFFLDLFLGIFGVMATAYFSRHREFKADAGAATLAGREKMISALKRLQGVHGRVQTQNEPASLAAFKISGSQGGFLSMLATHPPLVQRIDALEKMVIRR